MNGNLVSEGKQRGTAQEPQYQLMLFMLSAVEAF